MNLDQFSIENITESLAAALVKITAMGVKIIQAIHIPKNGDSTEDWTRFSPVVIIEK